MTEHTTGTREEAAAAQDKLLEREDELIRLGEELAEELRKLPWVPVVKEYTLDTDEGPKTLTEPVGLERSGQGEHVLRWFWSVLGRSFPRFVSRDRRRVAGCERRSATATGAACAPS